MRLTYDGKRFDIGLRSDGVVVWREVDEQR